MIGTAPISVPTRRFDVVSLVLVDCKQLVWLLLLLLLLLLEVVKLLLLLLLALLLAMIKLLLLEQFLVGRQCFALDVLGCDAT